MSTVFPTSSSLFGSCYTENVGDTDAVLLCVAESMESHVKNQQASLTSWLLILSGTVIFLMQLGFAMLCAGCVRRKNVTNTLVKNVLDACVAAIAFYLFGYAFAYGGDDANKGRTFIGTENFALIGEVDFALWFFQYCFAAANVTIIAGTLAERCQMTAYFAYSFVMSALIYPFVVHSIWSANGFLSAFAREPYRGVGVIDFAGSGVVHLSGGVAALVAAIFLGPRKGRFTNSKGVRLEIPRDIPGHSISLQVTGFLLLWVGWYSFNCGSALLLPNAQNQGAVAGRAAVNVTIAGAMGGLTAMLVRMYFSFRNDGETAYDISALMNGAMSGLVGVTAGCGTIDPAGAVVVGAVAGIIYLGSSSLLLKLRIDDAVDGIPIHAVGGAWGMIAAGLLSTPDALMEAYGSNKHVGWFYSMLHNGTMDATLFFNQIIGVLFISGVVLVTMTPFFLALNYFKLFRVDAEKEIIGLDASCMFAPEEEAADIMETVQNELRRHREAMENKAVLEATHA